MTFPHIQPSSFTQRMHSTPLHQNLILHNNSREHAKIFGKIGAKIGNELILGTKSGKQTSKIHSLKLICRINGIAGPRFNELIT